MFWNYLTLLQEIQWSDVLDIGLASCVVWFGLHVLRTRRTRKIGIGLLLYGMVMLMANKLDLKLTEWLLQGLSAVIILLVIVVYQSEIRRLLERFSISFLKKNGNRFEASPQLAELLSKVLTELSAAKTGALIVLPGTLSLDGVITAGIPLDGRISKSLLLSLFDPNSPGHDGALVIRGDRVELFGSRLPLSEQEEPLKERGTRHAAGLGLSEKTDAMVLLVSEESGRISIARDGKLQTYSSAESILTEITAFLASYSDPLENSERAKNPAFRAGIEFFAALVVTATFWLIMVPASVDSTDVYEVAVEVQNIPQGFVLSSVSPAKIAVTLTGQKRDLFKVDPNELLIRLDGTLTSFGRQTYPISSAQLLLPPNVEVADLAPEQVRVQIRNAD